MNQLNNEWLIEFQIEQLTFDYKQKITLKVVFSINQF